MKLYVAAVSLLLTGVANASTIIDFDSESLGVANPIELDGFRFEGSGLSSEFTPPIIGLSQSIIAESIGDNALSLSGIAGAGPFGDASGIAVTMTALGGHAFSFYGADLTTALIGDPAVEYSGITGQVVGGGQASGPIGSGDWLNLESVTFSMGAGFLPGGGGLPSTTLVLTIDNVNAQVVPVPAAVWLFGSALAGLGWMRRKQNV